MRAELGQLNDVAAEQAKAARDRAELVEQLRAEGLVDGPEPGEDELVLAVHELLARARSRLALISPYDIVGEIRQPNLPGTVDEYPNWRLPLPLSLEELRAIRGCGWWSTSCAWLAPEEQCLTCRSR